MKKHLLILLSIVALALGACKSKQEVAPVIEPAKWQNVSMPVTVTIDQPMSLTLNGTLTMVRGEYALVSFRTFGFEVASAEVTPRELNFAMKMPSKMWVNEPVGDRLKSRNIDFTQLQDDFVSENAPQISIPGLSVSTKNGTTTIHVSTTAKGMKLSASMSYNINNAKWDVEKPATFSTPGSDYRKLDLRSAAKALGK